ncbi:EamA family transporter [candidate division WOR-3 bacterium]|nr:EamA family transporter [candidate division WOR-3 bacterium]
MVYLVLAVFSSSLVTVLLKLSQKNSTDEMRVASFNYLSAFAVAFIMFFTTRNNQSFIASRDNLGTALFMGIFAGVIYLLGFVSIQKSVLYNGVATTGAVSKLGTVIPVLLSFIVFREKMNAFKTTGIFLSIISILMLAIKTENKESRRRSAILLFWVLVFVGMAEFSNKIFENNWHESLKNFFLTVVFATAFVLSFFFANFRNLTKIPKSALFGIAVGIPNLFSSFFLISSFKYFPAAVAFSFYSVGSILIMSLAGWILFGEEMRKTKIISLVFISVSLVFMNL